MSPGLRFAVFLSIVLGIWSLEHLYVGWRLLSLPVFDAPVARRALLTGLAIAFLTYPLGRTAYGVGFKGLGRTLEYVGAVWMGTLFLLLAALLVTEVVTLGGFAFAAWSPALRGGAVALALAAAAAAWVGGLVPPRTVELEVVLPGLHPDADGISLAQVSDVHLGTILGRRRLQTVIDRVDELEPDVVVITGDLVDGDAGVVEEMLPQLVSLRAPRGVFVVLGNHEYYAGRERSRRLLADAGFEVLDNEAVEVAPGLFVAGVPDGRGSAQTGRREDDLDQALGDVSEGAAVVLLQHSPENERAAAAAGVDLMLNGHTHGGQIWPFHLLVRRAFPNMAGVHRVGAMTQVISRGAGQWGPPMRLFASSDIVHITLRAASDPD